MNTVSPPAPQPSDPLSQLWQGLSGYKTYLSSAALFAVGLNLIASGNPAAGGADVVSAIGQVAIALGPAIASLRHSIAKVEAKQAQPLKA